MIFVNSIVARTAAKLWPKAYYENAESHHRDDEYQRRECVIADDDWRLVALFFDAL